jgi:hypothetical protein
MHLQDALNASNMERPLFAISQNFDLVNKLRSTLGESRMLAVTPSLKDSNAEPCSVALPHTCHDVRVVSAWHRRTLSQRRHLPEGAPQG